MCRCRWCAASARSLGRVLHTVAARRRRVVDTNLALCFPDKSPEERRRIARETFVYVAQSWLDRSWLWHAPEETVAARLKVNGRLARSTRSPTAASR